MGAMDRSGKTRLVCLERETLIRQADLGWTPHSMPLESCDMDLGMSHDVRASATSQSCCAN